MSGLTKIAAERNQKLLLELAVQPGNDICADCKTRNPRWASHNLGIFICMNCASIHRKIGTHITKVKSMTMDSWTKEQVESMKSMGNIKSNAIYNPNEIRHPPPVNMVDSERDSEMEQYIRSKYQFKRFLDKSALVASKLGPSRSASSLKSSGSLRSVSTPLTSATSATTASSPVSKTINTLPLTPAQAPKRPYTSANTSAPIPRAVSQPLSTAQRSQALPETKKPDAPGGVWDDLISLQTASSSSSLPLQYQVTPQQPSSAGMTAYTGGVIPFQQQQMSSNPFPLQLASSPGIPPTTYAGSQQSYLPNQPQVQTPVSASMQMQPSFFQPQPQQGQLQIQPSGGQPFASPITSGAFTPASASQGQFFSSSPAMPYPSHSPQVSLSMMSSTPQLQMSMQQPAQFISQSPHSMMTGTPFTTTPQPQTPMQMQMQQQGLLMAGMPQTGQFVTFQGQWQGQGQTFTPGGFTGQQWGAL